MSIQLRPHQEEGVKYLTSRALAQKGGYLYMEMRTGKTLTAIRALKEITDKGIYNPWPCLILAPKSVLATWEFELLRDGFKKEKIGICNKTLRDATKKLEDPEILVVLINYEKIVKTTALKARKWGSIIFDESIRIANAGTKVTTDVMGIRSRNEYQLRIALSGAPAGEGYRQLVAPAIAVDGIFCGDTDYMLHMLSHWSYNEYNYKWTPKAGTNKLIERWLAENTYRVTQADAGISSEKLYARHFLDLTKWQEKELTDLWSLERYTNRAGKELAFNSLSRHTFEHQIAQGINWRSGEVEDLTKVKAICDYVEELGEPSLVFGRFVAQLRAIQFELVRRKVKNWYIDGGVNAQARANIRAEFQGHPKGNPAVLVAQVVPVKMGIDLSNAHTIVYASSSFSHDDRVQSESRATHLLKEGAVQIVDFVTNDTLEPKLLDLLEEKKDWNQQAMTAYNEGRMK